MYYFYFCMEHKRTIWTKVFGFSYPDQEALTRSNPRNCVGRELWCNFSDKVSNSRLFTLVWVYSVNSHLTGRLEKNFRQTQNYQLHFACSDMEWIHSVLT